MAKKKEKSEEKAGSPPPTPRLQTMYEEQIVAQLREKLGRENRLSLPRLDKIVISMGVGSAVTDKTHSNVLYFDVDVPISNAQEANNIAASILADKLMNFITGDGICKGNPDLKPGIIVTANVGCKRFDGKYYITAVKHRYLHEGSAQGFRTHFKFRRDAHD